MAGLHVSEGGLPVSVELEYAPCMAQELRETFHDMQQPVASLLALAAAALTEPDLPATARRRLEQIAAQAEWLAEHGPWLPGEAACAAAFSYRKSKVGRRSGADAVCSM